MTRALVCLVLLLTGCASKEETLQSALNGGMLACDIILADKSLRVAPEALSFCQRMQAGCWEPFPEAKP